MMRRVVVRALWLLVIGGMGGRPAVALWVTAQGTYTDGAAKNNRGWQGRFEVVGNRCNGTISLTGIGSLTDVAVKGSVDIRGGDLSFSFTEAARLPGTFRGHVAGSVVQGSYTLGSTRGRWKGIWDIAPGAPATEIEEVRIEPDPLFTEPQPEKSTDLTEPPSCRMLKSGPIMALISAGGEAALRAACDYERSAASRSAIDKLLAYGAAWFPALKRWLPNGPPRAAAQSCGAQDNPVNCPEDDTYPSITQNEVSIGASGADTNTLVAGFNDSAAVIQPPGQPAQPGSIFTGYSRSDDQGTTWTDMGSPPLLSPSAFNFGDPIVVSDADGRFYFGSIQATATNISYIGVQVSTDAGVTFNTLAQASPQGPLGYFNDKPEMAADRRASGTCPDGSSPCAGNIYVCWTQFRLFGDLPPAASIMFSRSTNHGVSYNVTLPSITDFITPYVQGCSVAVGPLGDVYVAWWDASDNVLLARRSTDGGQTFAQEQVIGVATPPPLNAACATQGRPAINGPIRVIPYPNLVADPIDANYVYAVWNNWNGSKLNINFRRSSNRGQSWGENPVVLVNEDTFGDKFLPRMGARPTITFPVLRVLWYDRRNDSPHNLWPDVYWTASTDHGSSWQSPDQRLTAAPMPLPPLAPLNFDCHVAQCYFGDYNALGVISSGSNSLFVAGWGDTSTTASGTSCRTGQPEEVNDPNVVARIGC